MNSMAKFFARIWNRKVVFKKKSKIDIRAFVARGGSVSIGECSVVRAGVQLLPAGGWIDIGSNTTINHYTVINGEGGVSIGDHVAIAAHCAFYSSTHNYDDLTLPINAQGMSSKGGICIESDVWIGAGVIILDGVTIGKGSVIGAGSVVNRDIAPYSVAVGVPCRTIRSRI